MEHEQTKTNVKNNEVDEHPVNSKNVPAQMPSAFAGFSPESEVHIVSFLVFFPPRSVFLSLLLALEPFKMFPPL